jgi:hypothetical protein
MQDDFLRDLLSFSLAPHGCQARRTGADAPDDCRCQFYFFFSGRYFFSIDATTT